MGAQTSFQGLGGPAPAPAPLAPVIEIGVDTPRSVLVASTGGHLTELHELVARLPLLGAPLWVTFDTAQARSLLGDQHVAYVPTIRPRDLRNTLKNIPAARRILRAYNVVEVISTGAAVAATFLPLARRYGISAHYIESAARSHAPSMTGRLMAYTPGVHCYSQYERWAEGRWEYAGSILDRFVARPVLVASRPDRPLKVVVALGTQAFRFDRLVDAVQRVAQPNWSITWQLGPNDYGRLPGESFSVLDSEHFARTCGEADLVIGQAGVGTALAALEGGTVPILVPRDHEHGEHVDDHQTEIAEELRARSLAVTVEPELLTPSVVDEALGRYVISLEEQIPFQLVRQ